MRTVHLVSAAFLSILALPILVFACHSQTAEHPSSDGGVDASSDVTACGDASTGDTSVDACTLGNGSDPVDFCLQKQVLQAMHTSVFTPEAGVAQSWNANTNDPDLNEAGVPLHDFHDDLGYAVACSLFHTTSGKYGDTTFTPTLDQDLQTIAPLIESELNPLPNEYDGELYERLRVAAGGLLLVNDTTDGTAFGTLADSYGKGLFTRNYFPLAESTPDGGASEGGVDGGGAEGGGGDAAAGDGGGDAAAVDAAAPADGGAGSYPDGIIGQPNGSGAYAYVVADAATAAYALIDLASRYPTDANQMNWQLAAAGVLEHLYNRARDPASGLYFTALITSDAPDHDTLDPSNPESGTLLADTTATIALYLLRAQDLVARYAMTLDGGPGPLALLVNYPFTQRDVNSALAGLNGLHSLYDGNPADAGATSTGFMEGYTLSTQTLVTTKATRANSYALAAIFRQNAQLSTTYQTEIAPLFATITTPAPPDNVGLISVFLGQEAYLRATSRNFNFIGNDGGGTEPYPESYQSAANIAFVEGLTERLYTSPSSSP